MIQPTEIATLMTGSARLSIRVDRGGLVAQLTIAGQPVLYLDDATLADPTKNVRGGIPVLFPSPGKLSSDTWHFRGRTGVLKQHGFARTLAWTRLPSEDGVLLGLTWPGDAAWPWRCSLEQRYLLAGRTLRLEQRVTNLGDEEMPFGLGFHPYFLVPDAEKAQARIPTAATRAFDNVHKREISLDPSGLDLSAGEVDLHLIDHGSTTAELTLGARAIRLRGSSEYRRWVIWTLRGKDFVCLEPWTCPGDALNTGEDLLILAPGQARDLWLEIES